MLAAIAIVTAAITASASSALADCSTQPLIAGDPSDVRGTTFVGSFDGFVTHGPGTSFELRWTLERVYAGGPLPRQFTSTSPACVGFAPKSEGRYLFSTAAPNNATTRNSAAWTISDGEHAQIAPPQNYRRSSYPSNWNDLKDADLSVVLAAIAPGAGAGLPPTSTGTGTSEPRDPDQSGQWFLVGALAAGAVLLWNARRRRRFNLAS